MKTQTRTNGKATNAQPKGDEMQQNLTLSPQQERAVTALMAGQSVTAAAKVAEVARATVHRWLTKDFQFQAAVNQAKQELRESLQSRLASLATDAIACVETAIQAGDEKIAMALLRGLGLLSGKAPRPLCDDPQELQEDEGERKDRRRRMMLSLQR